MSIDNAGTITIADRTVPRFGYGTMRLTGPRIFGPPADRDEAIRVLRRAVEAGIRVIDTAWYYGPYVADEILHEALAPYPDDLVIVTKLGGARRDDASWYSALSAQELRAGCEHDLRLLGLEAIPVVHLRWMDNDSVDFATALETMVDLQQEGKIERIGLSNVGVDQLDQAAERVSVATVSNAYSVLAREHDDLVARCERDGIPFLPFFPLAATPGGGSRVEGDETLTRIAAARDATAAQVALAWLLARSPVIVPIPGTSRVGHLVENLAAADVELSAADLAALDALG
jgi:aryl-alcohol dehydrogenase-like predicted oxidoreductase